MELKTCRYCNEEQSVANFEIANIVKGKEYRRHRCKKCYCKSKNEYKQTKRIWFETYKKTLKCQKCGLDDFRVLDFHHRDSNTKDIDVSVAVSDWSIERLKTEIQKCDVLCSNCHRILHYEERKMQPLV